MYIFVVGLSGLIAQVLLVRELLVSFFGNELTLGIILANWLISEAAGVFFIGRAVDRIKNKFDPSAPLRIDAESGVLRPQSKENAAECINLFIALQVLFSLSLFLSVYLARAFKGITGIGPDQAIGLAAIFYASFFIILPVAFCHGALFSTGCKIYPFFRKKGNSLSEDTLPAHSIGRVYGWEVAGTLFGSIILTFFLIPRLNSFQIVFLIAVINLIACLFLAANSRSPAPKYIIGALLFCGIILTAGGALRALQNNSIISQRGANAQLLDYRNSVYGNVAVTRKEGQYTFFYNGLPVITTPVPDRQFVEDFGNLPLLFHPQPKEVLLIGGGPGGLINQMLRHPLNKLDYTELDPLIIEMVKIYPTALTDSELNDPRLDVKNVDARIFLSGSTDKYDLILIGLPTPADLSANRHFSREFFSLAKEKLKGEGILAFRLPGSLTYLSAELAGLNASILNALKNSYHYLRVIPGDYNIVLASDSGGILTDGPDEILQRLSERKIENTILLPEYLKYRLSPEKQKWFFQSLQGRTEKINPSTALRINTDGGVLLPRFKRQGLLFRDAAERINSDLRPFALFEVLSLWNKQFSKKITVLYESMQNLDLTKILLAVSILTLVLFFILRKSGLARISVVYSIFTTGFFGMLVSLVLIFAFQVLYGYLYRSIGLLIGLFMAGAACGSIFMSARLGKIRREFNLFAGLEALIITCACLTGFIIAGFMQRNNYSLPVLLALFYTSGLLLGLEFPLAAKIYLGAKTRVGEASGILYGADLLGGWLAGVMGGIIFLPVLGLLNTCLVMAAFKLSSLSLFLATTSRKKS